ncbi:hypothetical protein [Streptomyces phaeoluteigriseus]|uniref:hypothetical protein n=1 Tax=Streptomyces phaeoluteigriseus TaxID=114686 RepID=UPI00117C1B60|nr:hypothetical protein [Streptomyces phaeoluteigriseus]
MTIADGRGTLKAMAATEDRAAFIEPLRMQTGRGLYGLLTHRRGPWHPGHHRRTGRRPKLVPAMPDSGYRALHTVPLRLYERPLGAATPLNTRVRELSEGDARPARAPADSAALSLMHRSTEPARVDDVIARVRSAIAAKAVLEIA